ncbi:SIR2 family protein [Aromatoleum toluvorans]|uniref:SIR2 family protein n=1 Tax=Aromatoleum toluvorans TaxID=92002 RepID=A0ABX1PWP7_9RHOO|nr:SIR2 family protein [Aromatoleum toluvorans]NMG43859.1 SIR2 family protein [Aromatoleum toluvorans]
MTANAPVLDDLGAALAAGTLIPYLGPGMLDLVPLRSVPTAPVPASPEQLVARLTAKTAVPHKIRGRLTAAAQYIENFKHRKSLVALMNEAYAPGATPSALHRRLAALPLPLVVDAWYDDAMQKALAPRTDWGQVQGLAQSEHFGSWFGFYGADGAVTPDEVASGWTTLLYKPLGGVAPAANYLVSDSDYVEVLTEIDIQTPIPPAVQDIRAGRHFLFLGCRFNDQLQRSFARQIMKRSSDRHWAVLPGEPTRNELRFLAEQNIARIDLPLAEFAARFETIAQTAAA